MNTITQTIIETGKQELSNQISQGAATAANHTTTQLTLLTSLPWPVILTMIIISIILAWQLYKFIKFIMKWTTIITISIALLYIGLKILVKT